jgi:hypothetical protein
MPEPRDRENSINSQPLAPSRHALNVRRFPRSYLEYQDEVHDHTSELIEQVNALLGDGP